MRNGNTCKRGAEYARTECTDPRRTLTTTLRCTDGGVVAVKQNNDPEGAAVEVRETIESDDCVAAGITGRCLQHWMWVWQSDRGVPEPAKGLKSLCQLYSAETDLCLRSRAAFKIIRNILPFSSRCDAASGYPFSSSYSQPQTSHTYFIKILLKIKIIIVINIIKLYTGKVKSVRSDCNGHSQSASRYLLMNAVASRSAFNSYCHMMSQPFPAVEPP